MTSTSAELVQKSSGTRLTASAAIKISGVGVDFPAPDGGVRSVLTGIDLDIPAGQFTALVGRSGCGKTTLLNMVAGLVEPTKGTVEVVGKPPREARSELGFMLARDALLPWRNARRNVEYGLEMRGVPRAERRQRAKEWLDAVHLADAENLWPWQLSQGMRQRVALARTWALNPAVLLMDEPFAALDAQTRLSVQNEFLRLWQKDRDRSVLFVTHDLGEAIALADRIVLIGNGEVIEDIEVGIDRPRDLELISGNRRYVELVERLRDRLR